ncbi:hypothetical protein [Nonomuraea guangzhouensis]|uniref:MFS transporter n=1 Tax=Nonomuraea guangzhouensis TaxID=1291555 RepID=A0ABW4G6T0_9ACTN|nr:hypothetical protein [Nonomuraea guangzhouensis]
MSADQIGPAGRVVRAAVFAVACVYAALGMHVLAGGPRAGLGIVAAATAMTGAGAYVLARRRRSMGTLLAASFAAQYGMHHLFGSAVPLTGHHEGGLSAGLGMLTAHVLVATLSAWWLERGETALATLLSLLACSLRDLWRPLTDALAPPATTRRVAPVVAVAPAIRASQVLAWALCRRGPPQ